jgi:hypothetical protein
MFCFKTMKLALQVTVVAAAFLAGTFAHMLWNRGERGEFLAEEHEAPRSSPVRPAASIALDDAEEHEASRSSLVHPAAPVALDDILWVRGPRESSPCRDTRFMSLRPQVIDAILSRGTLEERLKRMDISDDQIAAVKKIKSDASEALKVIEAANAEAISDEKGEYVAIRAFPEERAAWLLEVETNLRALLGEDDRTTIVAKMIAFSDNDEDVGLYRRELFLTPSKVDDQRILIEERILNEAGKHIDSDYEELNSQSQRHWRHLVEFGDPKE